MSKIEIEKYKPFKNSVIIRLVAEKTKGFKTVEVPKYPLGEVCSLSPEAEAAGVEKMGEYRFRGQLALPVVSDGEDIYLYVNINDLLWEEM